MDKDSFNFDNKIYLNNNNILLEVLDELKNIMTLLKDTLIIKTLEDIMKKINFIFDENKKNLESIKNDFSLLNKKISELKVNNTINKKELIFEDGKYFGPELNGLPEGNGIYYYKNGSRYEGDFKNGKKEGKGIYYYENAPFKGDRYEGGWKNDKQDGKGSYYFKDGDIYEGEWKNGK